MNIPAYKGFISYSHADEHWASWLHRSLESYRVPGKLVGTQTPLGEIPQKLRPIFRDRDDLSSASDLSTTVKTALANSESLIVICSPNSAASQWVNEEIREFVRLGKQSRILCVIVDGDPASTEVDSRCFPPALAEAGLYEPLAADVRSWADGKHLARLKLVAGLLGLPLDQLRRRELQKRRKIQALIFIASLVVVVVLASAVWFQVTAQQRRSSGETLVSLKLNELRTLVKVTEDPEELVHLGDWDEQELASLITSAGTNKPALMKNAMALRSLGQKQSRAGTIKEALESFRKSWALIAHSYQLDRTDLSVFFELGQADYWIGQMHRDRGELDLAEHYFMSYTEITRRLILLQPQNDEWVMEMSYALTNLGMVQRSRRVSDPVRALQLMQSALEYNQIALVLDPKSSYYRSELGQSNANFADAQKDVCDLEGALASQLENISLQSSLYEANRSNISHILRLAFALSGYAKIQLMMGRVDEARPNIERSLKLMEEALAEKPGGLSRQRQVLERKQLLAWLDAISGKPDQAWIISNAIGEEWQALLGGEEWQALLAKNGSDDVRAMIAYSNFRLYQSGIASIRGDQAFAKRAIAESVALLEALVIDLPDNRTLGNLLTQAAFQYWETRNELPPQESWSLLPDYSANVGRTRACLDADMAVRQAIMQGNMTRAEEMTTYLLSHGYREPGFVQICTSYSICPQL